LRKNNQKIKNDVFFEIGSFNLNFNFNILQ
jgi:hypothetical protein